MDFEKNKILEIKSGSHLYGLNNENSDEDYIGIFLAPIDYHLGLKKVEQVDLSIKSKLSNGRNSKEAIDRTFYELKRFVKLSLDNNPNILEVLFVDKKNIVFINEYGKRLLALKQHFLSKKVIKTFLGFANSQKRKLETKAKNITILIEARKFLQKYSWNEGIILPELKNELEFEYFFKLKAKDIYSIGEYQINKNITVKEAIKKITEIIECSTNRKELIEKFGYDTKFAYHLVRILLELEEIITTNNLIFPLQHKELLFNIKSGKMELKDLILLIEQLEERINVLKESDKNILKEKPNYDIIEKELISIYYDFLFENKN